MAISCHHLQRLSLSELTLNSHLINCIIQNSQTLEVLDLSSSYNQCYGFEYSSEHHNGLTYLSKRWDLDTIVIVNTCVNLKELNMDYIGLSQEGMSIFCKNLTPKIQKLSFMQDGPSEVKYENIKILLNRCTNLRELNIINTRRGYGSGLTDEEIELFKSQFPQLTIYDSDSKYFPSIAQPSPDRDGAVCDFWGIQAKQIELFCGIGARDTTWSWWL